MCVQSVTETVYFKILCAGTLNVNQICSFLSFFVPVTWILEDNTKTFELFHRKQQNAEATKLFGPEVY